MTENIKISEKEIEEKVKFLSSAKCNHTPHMYIDITGDLVQGTLLSRIMYWFSVDKNKKSKVRIFKDNYFWIAKQRKDWWEEIRITERQYDKAIKELEKKGFVALAKYKFNSMPTIHIRPDYENINSATKEWENQLRKEIISEYKIELQNEEDGNNTKCNSQWIDTKCKTGVTQESNLLTLTTNIDYSNNDYSSENTSNSFSKEKDLKSNSPEGERSNSFSREKKTATSNKTKRHSEKEMEDMVNQIPLRARRIAYEMTGDTNKAARIYECIDYFLGKHKEYLRQRHKVLKDETLRKIVFKFIEGIEIERDGYTDVYDGLASTSEFVGDYRDVIDKYFNTDFKEKCDYSLVHFSSDTVLTNMMNHVCKEEWCESM